MPDTQSEIVSDASDPQTPEIVEDTPETSNTPSLEQIAQVLSPEQFAALLAQAPEEVLRTVAGNQQHPLGKVVQSEADRRMESWRTNELKRQNAERTRAAEAARTRWMETAPPDEVVERLREENRSKALAQQIQTVQFVAMFNELKPLIESLPAERRSKVEAFINAPGADEVWYKLPGLVHGEHKAYEQEQRDEKFKADRHLEEARKTASAVAKAPPTDVGKGGAPAGSTTHTDLLKAVGSGESDDIGGAIEALRALGVKGLPNVRKR